MSSSNLEAIPEHSKTQVKLPKLAPAQGYSPSAEAHHELLKRRAARIRTRTVNLRQNNNNNAASVAIDDDKASEIIRNGREH